MRDLITAADPTRMSIRNRFKPPSLEHPLGTDNLGRSQLARIVHGARLSLAIGFAVVVLNAVFGVLLGAAAGYFRRLDNILMRVTDALMAFPAVLLAIAIAAALGASSLTAVIALSVVYIPRTARIVRASVLVVRELEFVQAAKAMGASHCPHPVAAHPAQLHGAADRAAHLHLRLCRALRGGAELPGPRRGAADADLGQHHRRGAAVHARSGLDHARAGPGAGAHGASASTCSATGCATCSIHA